MSKSKVLIGMDKSGSYRVHLVVTTEIVEEARKIHHLTPLATAALGRTLTATGIMSLELKGDGNKLTVLFQGDGPARQILATGYGNGQIKGYISNPDVDLPLREDGKLDVGGAIGKGELTVIKDLGLKEPYVGSISLVSGEIAEDLTAYYFVSEQQNTSFALGVKVNANRTVKAAGGMFIQLLPNGEEGAVMALEDMIKDMKPITTTIEEVYLEYGVQSEEDLLQAVMDKIFGNMPEEYKPEVLEFKEIELKCDCSRDRMEKALMTVGKADLEEMIREDGGAELGCQFCGKKYFFTKKDLEEIIKNI